MLSCEIRGGVGNQMFQIAATYALALNNNDECAFDMDIKRKYRGVVHQGRVASTYFSNLYRHVSQIPPEWKPQSYHIEKDGHPYSPIPYRENLLLSGYFQSERYFEGRGEDIKKLFIDDRMRWGLREEFSDMLYCSVSLHVRRGDYVKFPEVHNMLDKHYYQEALSYIRDRRDIDRVFVFSDDIPWCRDNFNGKEYVFIEGLEDWEEIYLQSLCSHNIIANSSFSWWGAYFNENGSKIVVAPKVWFNPSFNYDHSKIYTEEMVII
jgi:hypothetical protein